MERALLWSLFCLTIVAIAAPRGYAIDVTPVSASSDAATLAGHRGHSIADARKLIRR